MQCGLVPESSTIRGIKNYDCVHRRFKDCLEKQFFRTAFAIGFRPLIIVWTWGVAQGYFFLDFLVDFFVADLDFALTLVFAFFLLVFVPNAEPQFSEYFLLVPLRKMVINRVPGKYS